MKVEFRVSNERAFKDALQKDAEKVRKASINAAKVEGYRLAKLMKQEMKAGAPGGSGFSPLSVIRSGKISGGRKPLSSMAMAPRYATINQAEQTKTMVGFLSIKLSRKWVQLADKLQDGAQVSADAASPIGSTYRKLFVRIGASIKKRNPDVARYYFLKKSTTTLVTPGRMIIVPFWRAHQSEAVRNIISNFERKIRGERI